MSDLFINEDNEIEVDIQKKYTFPSNLSFCEYEGKYLIIYTQGCLWLVLNTREEVEIFKKLQSGSTIEEVLNDFNHDAVISVLTQIEAKDFEHPAIKKHPGKGMFIYLTNNCNEHCKHCYMYAGDLKFEELSAQQWMIVLSEFRKAGRQAVTFSGGEVTVYPDFDKIIKHAHKEGLNVTVLSNGILWNEARIADLSNCINGIQISLDGYDKDSYFAVRQFDGFESALNTAKKFSLTKTHVSIAVTPLYDDLDLFIEKFEDFGRKLLEEYPNIKIRFSMELMDGRNICANDNKNKVFKEKVLALMERFYPNFYTDNFFLNYIDYNVKTNCGFGEIAVAPNGDVFWCNRIFDLKSTMNVTKVPFSQIIKKSEEIKILTDVNHSKVCSKCDVKYLCCGDCRIHYPGIKEVDSFSGMWENKCPSGTREYFYKKMIDSNEFFYIKR